MPSLSGSRYRLLAALLAPAAALLAPTPALAQADDPAALIELQVRKEELAYRRARTDIERRNAKRRLAQLLRDSDDPLLQARGLRIHLDANPGDQDARRELAGLAQERGRPAVAVRLFQQVLQARPGDLAARLGLAWTYEDLARFDEAYSEYEAVLARDRDNADALIGAAETSMSRNRPERALARAEAFLRVRPGDPRGTKVVTDARAEIAAGRTDAAAASQATPAEEVAELRTKLAAAPQDVTVRKALAAALLRAGRPGDAREEYLALVDLAPGDPAVIVGLAASHRELGDYSGARVYAEKAAQQAPRDEEVQLELARVYVGVGNLSLARAALERAAQIEPTEARPLVERAIMEAGAKQHKAALEYAQRARGLDAQDGTILALIAEAHFELGQVAEAEKALEASRSLDVREPVGWRLLARLHARAARWREAEQAWREFLFFQPFDVRGWVELGKVRRELNELPRAAQAFELAFSLDGDDPEVIRQLDDVLALQPFQREREETRMLLRERMARLAVESGKLDQAVTLLESVAEGRARQIRRVEAELHDMPSDQALPRRRAALRSLLTLTRAKVRAHRELASQYLDLERPDLVERQYLELHQLDPDASEWVRELALFYYDQEKNQRALQWFRRLQPGTRLSFDDKLKHAKALTETGRETQADRALRQIAATEPRDDEVQSMLADSNLVKGNFWAARRHSRRAVTLFGANQSSLDYLRTDSSTETPDAWVEFFNFDDSDGIEISQVLVGRRWKVSPRSDFAIAVSQFTVQDARTPELEDQNYQLLGRYELSERAQVSSLLGFTRFDTSDTIAGDLRLDYNPDHRVAMWLRLFTDSVNETPFASTSGFRRRGFEFDARYFAHHRWNIGARLEKANITGGNGRRLWNVDLALRPFGRALPGWFHIESGNLDFSKRVAPALYFSPDDQQRTDIWYETFTNLRGGTGLSLAYGLLRDIGFGLTHHLDASLFLDLGQRGAVSLDYTNLNRTRSYHDFSRGFDSDELTVTYNAQF